MSGEGETGRAFGKKSFFVLQRKRVSRSHTAMQVRIKENSWVAKIAAAKMKADKVAIVFGSTIHLHNTSRNEFLSDTDWVCHELKHVEQYQQNGFTGFLAKYLFDWMNHKFEIAARENEKDSSILKEMEII
jgi:hypothetical protein